ncbi:hypothetical protein PHMEG_00026439 [Phytophthora megakarya]|uniref:Retrotransposon gag domain-containing protein n=1 Tax=Phytophthora megakarya TaxID=4795 RepID=A0A225VAE2_9STRA|nr:hypothetical protein PHMEG_00026439 [Phytophthora megakarya]
MVGVYMATTGATVGQPYTAEQPTLYVPVAEYPPGQGARPPPPALPRTAPPVRNDGLGGSEEETKSDIPMTTRGSRLPEKSRDRDRDLQEADRQIAELRAALAARDELERIRNEEYRAARTAQAKLSREAWDRRETEFQERTEQEMERREVSGQEFAGHQAQMYLIEKERAREREESIQFRAEADRRMEAVTEKYDQTIAKAAAAIDETKLQADEELSRIKPEMAHQDREVELQEAQLEELRMYREQAAAGHSRRQPRERVFSPRSNGSGRARGAGAFGFPAAGGYAPGYGVSFRPFIAYDAVEPFDTSLSLDKRRAWWDKFQYTASSGGWREQELCTRLYSRLSHNPDTKAWVQQLPESVRRSWKQLSDRFYKEFCRFTESPVERYLGLKQESRETPRAFLWRLNAAATKANVDFHSASGCRLHVNQFLKNLRDRELQLSLQGRVYFTTDELEDVLKQVEEME